ncbi:MAG: NAD(P)/FAD-dependent oxidoreductase [Solirubrobacterales bacterium]
MADEGRDRSGLGTAILGAGPAGLTSAWVLARRGQHATVLEADGVVGGIAKTVEFEGYRFDLGGHRFYTKMEPVLRLWEEMLGDELLTRPRMSRIYYRGRFFNYPLRAADVLSGLGLIESIRCGLSYFYWRRKLKNTQPRSFEDWVVRRFGQRLYDAFFRSYTEKVWGIPGSEIQAEWAAQRIQEFSLLHAIMGILRLNRFRRAHTPTLIENFLYPRLGPGQMWEAFADWVGERGIETRLNNRVVSVRHSGGRAESVVVRTESEEVVHDVEGVLSSIPLSELVESLDPPAPVEVRAAARQLRYRGLCLVALMTTESEPFPDNWIYLHDARTTAGRVQNFGAWSKDMVPKGATCLGVEYFCNEGDAIWDMSDEESVQMATDDLERIGLLDSSKVFNGVKVRVPKAYPMYDQSYREAVAEIRGYLEHFENLKTFGRNGLHRYNNQDHSMWTAILATLSYTDGIARDVWSVNTKAEYLEEGPLAEGLAELDLVA